MNKILIKFYPTVLLVMLGMAAFQFFSPADRPDNINRLSRMQAAQLASAGDYSYQQASGSHLIAGICAILLVGYLFWYMVRKFQNDSRDDLDARKNSLYTISLATGQTEYDLFRKSAEGWSVSAERIDQDFIRYMADQVMPHYAQDFVRKNRTHIDESLIVKRNVKPTSWADWAIAVLVFPGSILLLYVLMSLFDRA